VLVPPLCPALLRVPETSRIRVVRTVRHVATGSTEATREGVETGTTGGVNGMRSKRGRSKWWGRGKVGMRGGRKDG